MEQQTQMFEFFVNDHGQLVESRGANTMSIDDYRQKGWVPVDYAQVGNDRRYQVIMEKGYARR